MVLGIESGQWTIEIVESWFREHTMLTEQLYHNSWILDNVAVVVSRPRNRVAEPDPGTLYLDDTDRSLWPRYPVAPNTVVIQQ